MLSIFRRKPAVFVPVDFSAFADLLLATAAMMAPPASVWDRPRR